MARCLFFLNVLTGSVATKGGTAGNGWNKFVPQPPKGGQPITTWNEMSWPKEYPLAYHEMSILLPHFLNEGRGKLDTYFSRVYNPIWTNPDGFSWMEALLDESKVELPCGTHTDLVGDLLVRRLRAADGARSERHDVASYETHAGRWIGFRQPVMRRYAELNGEEIGPERRPTSSTRVRSGRRTSSGSTCRGGSTRTARSEFASSSRATSGPARRSASTSTTGGCSPNSVPGLAEAAAAAGVTPLEYMRDRGAFAVPGDMYQPYEKSVAAADVADCTKDASGVFRKPGTIGTWDGSDETLDGLTLAKLGDGSPAVEIDGEIKEGFPTPSKKLELFSTTLKDWGWPEYATPKWIPSHVHWEDLDMAGNERILLPTFRIPTLIHTRSANSKWLNEISHRHPLWIHPSDAEVLGIEEKGLVRITTRIGHFVIAPGAPRGSAPASSLHRTTWGAGGSRRTRPARSARARPGSTTTARTGSSPGSTACAPGTRVPTAIPTRNGSGGTTPACIRT